MREWLKDQGRKLIGQGAEVNFKNDAREYARTRGVPIEAAQKAVLAEWMGHLRSEIGMRGGIEKNSKQWRGVRGGLNELFGKNDLDAIRTDGRTVTPTFPGGITPRELRRAEGFFKSNFGRRAPDMRTLDAHAKEARTMDGLMNMLAGDPRFGAATDVKHLIATNPDLRAYLGRALLAKDGMEGHERHFGRELAHEKTMEELKGALKDSLATMVWKAPSEYMKAATHLRPNLPSFFKFGMETGKFLGKEAVAAGTLAYHGTRAVASKINTLRK